MQLAMGLLVIWDGAAVGDSFCPKDAAAGSVAAALKRARQGSPKRRFAKTRLRVMVVLSRIIANNAKQ
jgi:hypothetical protein